jgi:hypothetical protein
MNDPAADVTDSFVPAAGRAWLTGGYDRAVAVWMRERAWRPSLVAAVARDLPSYGTLVEVGCGTGSLTVALAAAGFSASRRHAALRTVWGTLEVASVRSMDTRRSPRCRGGRGSAPSLSGLTRGRSAPGRRTSGVDGPPRNVADHGEVEARRGGARSDAAAARGGASLRTDAWYPTRHRRSERVHVGGCRCLNRMRCPRRRGGIISTETISMIVLSGSPSSRC